MSTKLRNLDNEIKEAQARYIEAKIETQKSIQGFLDVIQWAWREIVVHELKKRGSK